MGKTSSESKNRYNAKAYDRISVTVKKGSRERIQLQARRVGLSVNAYIKQLLEKDIGADI